MAEQDVISFHAECYAKAKGVAPAQALEMAVKEPGNGERCVVCGQVIGYWYKVTEDTPQARMQRGIDRYLATHLEPHE